MSSNLTLKEVKERIINEIDIAQLYSEMIDEHLIDSKKLMNPHLVDEKGNIRILFDFTMTGDMKEYSMIVCPFHDDKDPSASLHRLDGTFKCFSGTCKTKGKRYNIIDFYMMLRFGINPTLLGTEESNKEFIQTLNELGERIGVGFRFESRQLSPEEVRERKILDIRRRAADLYHWAWKNNKFAEKAKEYMLEKRGFKYSVVPFDQLVQKYKIGYAPGYFGWTWLYDRLKKEFSDQELLDASVVYRYQPKEKIRDANGRITHTIPKGEEKIIDMLTNGVVVPYFQKKKIGNLYARNLDTNNDKMRHMRLKVQLPGIDDSPMNLDVAKNHHDLVIVEGELSWLSLVALGFENIVCSRGTNGFRQEHIEQLKARRERSGGDHCQTIYLCLDTDLAGQEALAVLGERLVKESFDVRVIRLPQWVERNAEGVEKVKGDPNDFLQKYQKKAKETFESLKDQAITYEAFMILFGLRKKPIKTHADAVAALKRVRPFVQWVPKDQLLFISYEIAEILKLDVRLLHQAWIKEEVKKEEEEIPGLKEALNENWVFAIDDPSLYEKLKQSKLKNHIVNVSESNIDTVVSSIKEKQTIWNVAFNSRMDREKKNALFKGLNGYKFLMFVEKEEFTQKDDVEHEELMKYFQQPS